MMRAKILKSRDSAGVGGYINFHAQWATLSFVPFEKDEDEKVSTQEQNRQSNIPKKSNGNSQKDFSKQTKPNLKRDKKQIKLGEDNPVDKPNGDENASATRSVINGIKGRNKPFKKIIKNL